MKPPVRQLSGACPGGVTADTAVSSGEPTRANCTACNKLQVPDKLSAQPDISSAFDKPDKTTPPYRGGLSVSAAEIKNIAFNASSNGSSVHAPAPLDAGVSIGSSTISFVHLDGGSIVPSGHMSGQLALAAIPAHFLLTPDEVATLLRKTRKAVYKMNDRGQLPGVKRIGRKLLFRRAELVKWLRENSSPSPRSER